MIRLSVDKKMSFAVGNSFEQVRNDNMETQSFTGYCSKFSENNASKQTHLAFRGGKYNVPDGKYEEFYKNYFEKMSKGEELFMIEKIHNSLFTFFMDIEAPKGSDIILDDESVRSILGETVKCLREVFVEPNVEYIVSKSTNEKENKYHVNFPNIITNSNIVKEIFCTGSEENSYIQQLMKCVDTSVYRTGLRMLGSKKKVADHVYKLYDLEKGGFSGSALTWETFKKCVIRVPEGTSLTPTKHMLEQTDEKSEIAVKGIGRGDRVEDEIKMLLTDLLKYNECIGGMDMNPERIYATRNKAGIYCYYISVGEKYCPFKCREHKRDSSPIYIEVSIHGVFVKCYDSDCLRRRFPEGGLNLPVNMETAYPELYKNMSTKFWEAEVEMSEGIKKYLEDSLTGSHYQIGKAIFNIYKDLFRIDDIKNTTWYEFDGVRWKVSHMMNILMSEELPKYYRSLKISDTSASDAPDLAEFLVNSEKVDVNYRNGVIDKIIGKLENVAFKSNVMNQVGYLFKNHDPDFNAKLDENPYFIGFNNGVYDLKSNEFRQTTGDDYLTYSVGYDFVEYDENAQEVVEIYDFLSKIIPNQKVREYLLKVLGKSLVGIPDEKFYIWTGLSGANGKSTLVNFMERTLGDYITSVDVSLLTNKRGNSSNASPDVVRLKGKRFFTFQEPEHDDKLRTGILKQFTGGDTIIARELFKAPITFKLQGTMIMCCNDLPTVQSIDGGTWRRIRVIEFNSRFCDNPNPQKPNEFKIDPTIRFKMEAWRPYFMSILLHWYKKFLEEPTFEEPSEVKKATNKYKIDNDKFNEYFDVCLEENAGGFESNKNIYGSFSNWWSSNYPTGRIPDIKELRRAMKVRFGSEKERPVDGIVSYGFNVKFRDSFDM